MGSTLYFHQITNQTNRSEPESILHNFIRGFGISRLARKLLHFLISAPFLPLSSDYSSLRPQIFSFPAIFVRSSFLSLTLPCICLIPQSICNPFNSRTWAPFAVVLRFALSFLPLFRSNLSFKGHRFRRRCQPLPFHAPQMCRKRRFWKGTFPKVIPISLPINTSPRFASFNTSRHATCTPSNTSTKQSACE
jgi:hypothetical protein